MATFYYLVRDDNVEERESAPSVDDDGTEFAWIHVLAPEPGELERELEGLGVSAAVVETASSRSPHPGAMVNARAFVCTLPLQIPGEWTRTYLRYVIRGRTLVTATESPIPYLEELRQGVVERGMDSATGPMGEILFASGRADELALQELRAKVDEVEARIHDDPDSVSYPDIFQLKIDIQTCGNICEDQVYCMASTEAPAVREAVPLAIEPHQATVGLVRYIDRSFDRLETRARQLEGQLQMLYQRRTEDRLRILTVISAVFMPLSLLAGIYGMNFAWMPELHEHYGYPLCLGAMALVATGMLGWFYRRGWLAPS